MNPDIENKKILWKCKSYKGLISKDAFTIIILLVISFFSISAQNKNPADTFQYFNLASALFMLCRISQRSCSHPLK